LSSVGGSDVRAMIGYASVGPGVVLEPLGPSADLSPYVHAFAVGASADAKLRRGARRLAVQES